MYVGCGVVMGFPFLLAFVKNSMLMFCCWWVMCFCVIFVQQLRFYCGIMFCVKIPQAVNKNYFNSKDRIWELRQLFLLD